jgi:hypothetical protein
MVIFYDMLEMKIQMLAIAILITAMFSATFDANAKAQLVTNIHILSLPTKLAAWIQAHVLVQALPDQASSSVSGNAAGSVSSSSSPSQQGH